MNKAKKALGITDDILTKLLRIISIVLLVGSCYMFFDIYFLNRGASSDRIVEKYKPEITVTEENSQIDLTELQRINPDIKGWLTVDNTGIDYPVLQGEDDYQYLNRDFNGESSLTGSLYFRSIDALDDKADYRMIYGHHMDASSMFGCLDSYIDPTFFNEHKNGTLILAGGVWDLEAVALLYTHAYNNVLYHGTDYSCIVKGLESLHIQPVTGDPELIKGPVLILSTCYEAKPNGRLLLVLTMTKNDNYFVITEEPEEIRTIQDRRMGKLEEKVTETWSLLSLTFVIILSICCAVMVTKAVEKKEWLQLLWALPIIVSVIALLKSQRFNGSMVLSDRYTIGFALLSGAIVIFTNYSIKKRGENI